MNKKIILIIAFIIICIIAITVPLVIFLRKKNNTTTNTTTNNTTSTPLTSALNSSGLAVMNREGFENIPPEPIVFDTIEKIMTNFETFINLYFPKLKDIIDDVNMTISADTDYFPPNSTVYSILAEAAQDEEHRNRFKLKPIIDIYSHLLLADTNDETMNNNFNLAMIGLIIFLNAKDIDKTYQINDNNGIPITGRVVYKYNSDYDTTKELRIFMDSGVNTDKPLKKEHSLRIEKDCIIDNLCYTTSEDLKIIYMKETDKDSIDEKERLKQEVSANIEKYKAVLKLLFIANLKLMLNPGYNNINQVLNDTNDKNNRELAGLRGILVSSIKSNHFKLDENDVPSPMNNIKIIGNGLIYKDNDGKLKRVKISRNEMDLFNKLKNAKIREIIPETLCANIPNENCSNASNLLNSLCTPSSNNKLCTVANQLNSLIGNNVSDSGTGSGNGSGSNNSSGNGSGSGTGSGTSTN